MGQHPNFKANALRTFPEKSRSYIGRLFVGYLPENSVNDVKMIIDTTEVDNETVEWDCQEYVLDILDRLQGEFFPG